jgi:streptogramin lyase
VLEIWLFGRVRFRADGGSVVEIKPERAQRLLAWLALQTRSDAGAPVLVARRSAVHALWGRSDAARPENSLAQALRELRATLGPAYAAHVVDDRDVLGLIGDVWTDVGRFRELARSSPAEALALSDRPLLEFVVRSGSHWDHARRADVERERARLRAAMDEPAPAADAAVPPSGPPRARRGRALWAAVALALVAAVIAIARRHPSTDTARGVQPCPAGYTEPDPADARAAMARTRHARPRLRDEVLVGIGPTTVATGKEGLWVGDVRGVTLVYPHGDPQRRPVIPTGDGRQRHGVFDIALARDRVWVTRRDGTLISIDRATREVVGRPIRYGSAAADVALAGGRVWINGYGADFEGTVARIDPCSRTTSYVRVGRDSSEILAAFGSIWVSNPLDKTVERLDARTGRRQATVAGVEDPQDTAQVGDELWVVQYGDQTLVRIDPATNRLVGEPIRVGPDPAGIAVTTDAVWIPLYGNGTLTRIDRDTLKARLGTIRMGNVPTDVAAGFGRLWAPDSAGDSVAVVAP